MAKRVEIQRKLLVGWLLGVIIDKSYHFYMNMRFISSGQHVETRAYRDSTAS